MLCEIHKDQASVPADNDQIGAFGHAKHSFLDHVHDNAVISLFCAENSPERVAARVPRLKKTQEQYLDFLKICNHKKNLPQMLKSDKKKG